MNSQLKEKLLKLLRLSKQGVGGERDNAEALLTRLLHQHGMKLSDIDDASLEAVEVRLTFSNGFERKLANQVIYAVLGDVEYTLYRSKRTLHMKVTPNQKAEITVTYDVLRRSLKQEMKTFYSAFIMRNSLYPSKPPESLPDPTPEQLEELRRAQAMSKGIQRANIHKQIVGDAA